MIGTSLVYLAVRINLLNLLVQYYNSLLYSIVIVNRFPITTEYLSVSVFAHNKGYWQSRQSRSGLRGNTSEIAPINDSPCHHQFNATRDSIAVIFMAYNIRGSELSILGNTTANELIIGFMTPNVQPLR